MGPNLDPRLESKKIIVLAGPKADLEAAASRVDTAINAANLHPKEAASLNRTAWWVASILVSVLTGTGVAVIALMNRPGTDWKLLALVSFAGMFGGAAAAIRSFMDRRAAGWEFEDGTKFPTEEPKEKFVARMVPALLLRPFLSAAMGLVFSIGLLSGLIANKTFASSSPGTNLYLLVFLAIMGGFFAKTLWDWLNNLFKNILKLKP